MPLIETLDGWLAQALPPAAASWLRDQLARIATADRTTLAIALGHAGRRCGASPLPAGAPVWTTDQAVRVRLVAALPAADPARWQVVVDRLFATASIEELVALYQGLSWYPHPDRLVLRAQEGIRHSATAVFAAVALDNDFPAAHLPEPAFNQLVLKAFFQGCDVDRIRGLESRLNPALGAMLRDYARERTAAKRTVDERVWRMVQ